MLRSVGSLAKKQKRRFHALGRLFAKDMNRGLFVAMIICLVSLLLAITAVALQATTPKADEQSGNKSITPPVTTEKNKEKSSPASPTPGQTGATKSQSPQPSGTAKSTNSAGSPAFSLSSSQISLAAGDASPSIVLQSTSGKVYWKIEGSTTTVYTMLDNGVSLHAPIASASFHVQTGADATPKTYQFTVRASTDYTFQSAVTSKTLSVTVNPRKDFKVAFSIDQATVDDVVGQAVIPFTITRIGGHSGSLSANATIVHAAGFHSMSMSAAMTGNNSGHVVVTIPPGTPSGDYIVQVIVQDIQLTTHTDEAVLEIY